MLILLFWSSLFLILSSYLGYPLILVILSAIFGKEPKKADITPSVSLLIPAYNEEKVIAQKLENSLALDYPRDRLEIIVASESNDKTNEIVKGYQEKGVQLFIYQEREGQSALIYKTVPKCRGEIIVFTDANAILTKDALKQLVRNFAEPEVGCVSGQLKYPATKKMALGQTEGLYWRYEIFLKEQESKLLSLLGASGSLYALRKELYSPLSKKRSNDFELPIRVRQQGYGVLLEKEALSFEDPSPSIFQEFKRKSRMIGQFSISASLLLKKSFSPFQPLLIFQLIFHKILRWLGPLFLILIFTSNLFLLAKPFYRWTMLLQIGFYCLALFGWQQEMRGKKVNPFFSLLYYFFMVNLACLVGLLKALLGLQKSYWEKVR
jgi:cellulose synthase/poly-beta-1,6-N-acetylglucosamine synthase-like glycosyltransferase